MLPVNRKAISLPVESPKIVKPLHHKSLYTPAKSKHTKSKSCSCSCSKVTESSESDDSSYCSAKHQSCLSKFLEYPSSPARKAGISEEKSARVLTSRENLQRLEEKKLQKEEEKDLKRRRAEERKLKKELKERLHTK